MNSPHGMGRRIEKSCVVALVVLSMLTGTGLIGTSFADEGKISRAVRASTVPPAGKVFLFVPAIPLDIVMSPFAAIAGLFGD